MKNFLFALAALSEVAVFAAPASAQQSVQVVPLPVTTTVASGTIASTNTFQSVFSAASAGAGIRGRTSCLLENNGTHLMYVFFGPVASASLTNAFQLGIGSAISCQINGATLQDQVSITGTSGDAFAATQQ